MPIVHIDFDPAEVYTHYNPVTEVVGDSSAALWEQNQKLDDSSLEFSDWYVPYRKRILDDINSYRLQEGEPFTVPAALLELRDTPEDTAPLIREGGTHKTWNARD